MSKGTVEHVTSVRELIGKSKCHCACLLITDISFVHHRKFDKFTAELHPIPVRNQVWHTIGIDLIGPLPTTPRGNKYIMTVSCFFSKWPEATALADKTAIGVAEFLFKLFTRHGCCKVKISDQGREFVNKVNKCNAFKTFYYNNYHFDRSMMSFVTSQA